MNNKKKYNNDSDDSNTSYNTVNMYDYNRIY